MDSFLTMLMNQIFYITTGIFTIYLVYNWLRKRCLAVMEAQLKSIPPKIEVSKKFDPHNFHSFQTKSGRAVFFYGRDEWKAWKDFLFSRANLP